MKKAYTIKKGQKIRQRAQRVNEKDDEAYWEAVYSIVETCMNPLGYIHIYLHIYIYIHIYMNHNMDES